MTVKGTQIKSGVLFLIFCLPSDLQQITESKCPCSYPSVSQCCFIIFRPALQLHVSLLVFFFFLLLLLNFSARQHHVTTSHCQYCLSSRLKTMRQINSKQIAMLLSAGHFNGVFTTLTTFLL